MGNARDEIMSGDVSAHHAYIYAANGVQLADLSMRAMHFLPAQRS